MVPNAASRIRAEQAKRIVQKARAVADGVRDDRLRLEGALVVLDELQQRLNGSLEAIKQAYGSGEDPGKSEGARDALLQTIKDIQAHRTDYESRLTQHLGRQTQCQQHIELLEGIAQAEAAEAEREHVRPEGGPGHPGGSLAQQRRSEADSAEDG